MAPPTIPPRYIRVRSVVWECGEGQPDTQTTVANTHFASATPHATCNEGTLNDCIRLYYITSQSGDTPSSALSHRNWATFYVKCSLVSRCTAVPTIAFEKLTKGK